MSDAEHPGLFRRLFGAKSTIDGMQVAEPSAQVVEMLQLYGGGWTTLGGMYTRQPAVRTVVDFLGRNIGGIGVKTYERVSQSDRVELDTHPATLLLRKPNPRTTGYRHMFATVADLAIYDVAYWYKFRDGAGRVRGLLRLPVPFIVLDTQTVGTNEQVTYRWQDGRVIARDDLVVFGGYSPSSNIYGTPPLETLRRVLAEDWMAGQDREGYWANAARIAGVIERPLDAPAWSDTARDRFRKDWEAAMTGAAQSGKTGILEEGMKWNSAQFSPKDSQYLEGRKLTREEVARSYGIPPTMVGILDNATFSNVTEQHKNLYQDVLGPWTRRIEADVELQLLPEFEAFDATSRVYVEFNIEEKLRGSFEDRTRSLTASIGVPLMSVNEGRGVLNLPKIDDPVFDVPVMPSNVIYGGQPAVNVPLADPGTPPGLASAGISDALAAVLTRTFDRQRRSMNSASTFDASRWSRELADDLGACCKAADLEVDGWPARAADSVISRTQLALAEYEPAEVFAILEGRTAELARDMADDLERRAGGVGLGSAVPSSIKGDE